MLKLFLILSSLATLLGASHFDGFATHHLAHGKRSTHFLNGVDIVHLENRQVLGENSSVVRRQNGNGNNGGGGNNNDSNNGGGNDRGGNDQGGNNDGAGGGGNNNNDGFDSDPQESLCLVENQVSEGSKQDGQGVQEPNQVASATSGNNFINFCLTRSDLPLTSGAQVKTGSCNGIPMGVIGAQSKMPSSKFTSPANLDVIPPNEDFTIRMKINNLVTGNFVNAQKNYFSAPQNTDPSGIIIGHSHVVIEEIGSLTSTDVTDPQVFAFFKGLNAPATNGVLSTDVVGGLPAGVYKMSSINSAANHQPVLLGVAQHGSLDDAVYFTVSDNVDNGNGGNGGNDGGGNDNQVAESNESSSSSFSSSSSSSSSGSSSSSFRSSSSSSGRGGRNQRSLEEDESSPIVERETTSAFPSLLEERLESMSEQEKDL